MNRLFLGAALLAATVPAMAGEGDINSQSHAWGSYHWSRSAAQITPPVHNNLTNQWQSYFQRAMSDWNKSRVIESPWGSAYGAISSRKRCTSTTGKIEVCNDTYGTNGWLGIAGISLSGGHIIKGYTKLNDSYFNTAQYNKASWRAMVTCQEIGHDYGLGHVNENFNDPNTGSCMDYTNDPARNDGKGTNMYPNAHDYSMLESIYNHTHAAAAPVIDGAVDAFASRTLTVDELIADAGQWGTPISYDGMGRPDVFFRASLIAPHHGGDHISDGEITHVFWAPINPFAEEVDPMPEDGIERGDVNH